MRQLFQRLIKFLHTDFRNGGIESAVICLLVCFCFSANKPMLVHGQAPSVQDTSYFSASADLTLEVSYGYENNVKGGRYVPLRVQINNPMEGLFLGNLAVLSMESDYQIYRYEYQVSMEHAGRKDMLVYVPIGARADQLFVILENQDGEQIIKKRLKLNTSLDTAELFIGILSDNQKSLAYLNDVGIRYSSLLTRTFPMNQETFPAEEQGLNLLDILLITDYNVNRLSSEQQRAIQDWVRHGGILILGTGSGLDTALGPWEEELLEGASMAPVKLNVDMGVEYGTSGPADSTIELVCVDLSLRSGNVILSSDEMPVLTSITKENGMIAIAAYDFTEIAEFCETNISYVDKLFTKLLGEDRIKRLSESNYSGNSTRYWSVQSMINTGNVDKLPNLNLYVVIILFYIVLVGPGLYLYLKKQKMRRFYRRGVLILSVCFTCIIYLLGSRTRFQSAFFTYATIQDISEDTITENTFINIRNPYNEPYSVSLDPSYAVRPITRNYDHYPDTAAVASNGEEKQGMGTSQQVKPRFTGNEGYQIAISQKPSETTISARNVVSFIPKYFQLEKWFENVQKVGITGDITLFEGKISGTLTNHFDHAVENIAVLFYGQMVMIDKLNAGETKILEGLNVLNAPLNNSDVLARKISGTNHYEKADIKNKDYMLAVTRENLLIFYLNNYATGYHADARILAFSTEKTESQFLINNNYETFGLTMFTSMVKVNRTQGSMVNRPAHVKPPGVLSGSYNALNNTMSGLDPLTLEYYLGNDIDVDWVGFRVASAEFMESEYYNFLTPFGGNIYFYNYNTGVFDRNETVETRFSKKQLEPYLSPGNTLRVKFVYDDPTEYNLDIMLPILNLAGTQKE